MKKTQAIIAFTLLSLPLNLSADTNDSILENEYETIKVTEFGTYSSGISNDPAVAINIREYDQFDSNLVDPVEIESIYNEMGYSNLYCEALSEND